MVCGIGPLWMGLHINLMLLLPSAVIKCFFFFTSTLGLALILRLRSGLLAVLRLDFGLCTHPSTPLRIAPCPSTSLRVAPSFDFAQDCWPFFGSTPDLALALRLRSGSHPSFDFAQDCWLFCITSG